MFEGRRLFESVSVDYLFGDGRVRCSSWGGRASASVIRVMHPVVV